MLQRKRIDFDHPHIIFCAFVFGGGTDTLVLYMVSGTSFTINVFLYLLFYVFCSCFTTAKSLCVFMAETFFALKYTIKLYL